MRDRDKLAAAYAGREPDGLVLRQFGTHAEVVRSDGVSLALLTPKVHKLLGIAAGDRVFTEAGAGGERILVARAERQTELRRRRSEDDRVGHVIAANLDQLAIAASLREPPLRVRALDRYLMLASSLGVSPLLVLTKIDEAPPSDPGWAAVEPYRAMGVPMLPTSATTGEGVPALAAQLAGRITAFAGHSGVGKSSLCRALGLDSEVGDLSRGGGRVRGRHTTSVASLLALPGGGYVVDTPGVRAIGLVDLRRGDVRTHFPDFEESAAACEFSDCAHEDEEGCAVREATERGDIAPARYESYLRLLASIE